MKQIIQDIRNGQTSIAEVPVPKPGPGMALVRTAASLVSAGTERALVEFAAKGLVEKARSRPDLVRQTLEKARRDGILTTLDAVQSRLNQPMPLGYSSAGTIVETGEGLADFHVGDRVACAGGGYAVHAEYAIVPHNLMVRLPDTVDFESGAFCTLGAIALHAFRLAETQVGERVAVIGLGLLGLLAAEVARAAGCLVFGIELDSERVERAHSLGFPAVIRLEAEQASAAFTQGHGFDAVLVCADSPSNDTVELAGAIARDRGHVVAAGVVGTGLPRKTYYEKELTFRISRSYGPGRYDPAYEEAGHDYPAAYVRWTEGRNLEAFVGLLSEGKVDVRPLITHRFPIERGTEAYSLIASPSAEPFLGVLLTYPAVAEPVIARQPVPLSQKPIVASTPVRLGALGAGNFAMTVLFPALRHVSGIEPFGLATATGLKATDAGRRFGFRYATTDEAQVLSDPEINTIAILTRHHHHARQVVAALRAGKHVFCEKPLALTREELLQVAKALQGSSGLLMVGFNRRFAPLAQRLKEFLVPSGEPLAMHYRINAGALPLSHWQHDPSQGGGRIIGEACHFIDFLTFLVGAPPKRVQTHGLPDSDRYRQDNVVLTLEFPDGSLGTVTYLANGDRAFPKERLEVFGGGRVAVLDDFRRLSLMSGGRRQSHSARLSQDKGHRAEWQAFVAAIAAGGPPPIPYDQLFAVTLASFAAVDSLRTGQAMNIEPLRLD